MYRAGGAGAEGAVIRSPGWKMYRSVLPDQGIPDTNEMMRRHADLYDFDG